MLRARLLERSGVRAGIDPFGPKKWCWVAPSRRRYPPPPDWRGTRARRALSSACRSIPRAGCLRHGSERTIRWAIRRPIQTISTTAARPGAIHWPSARCMPASIAASAQTMAPSPMMRLRDMADPLASALTIADSPARVPPKVPVRCRPSTERARAPGAIPDRPSVTPSRGDPG